VILISLSPSQKAIAEIPQSEIERESVPDTGSTALLLCGALGQPGYRKGRFFKSPLRIFATK
jgi:hypothetical protein